MTPRIPKHRIAAVGLTVVLSAGSVVWAQTEPSGTTPPVATSTSDPAVATTTTTAPVQGQVVIGAPEQQPPAGGIEYAAPPPFTTMGGRPPRWRTHVVPYAGGSVPPGGVLSSRANVALLGAGGGLLAAGWAAAGIGWIGSVRCSSGFLSISCSSASGWLWIPVIGPWLALTDSRHSALGNALIVVDGVVQVAGLVMMIVGAAARQPVVEFRSIQARSAPRSPAVAITAWPGGVALAF